MILNHTHLENSLLDLLAEEHDFFFSDYIGLMGSYPINANMSYCQDDFRRNGSKYVLNEIGIWNLYQVLVLKIHGQLNLCNKDTKINTCHPFTVVGNMTTRSNTLGTENVLVISCSVSMLPIYPGKHVPDRRLPPKIVKGNVRRLVV